MCIVFNAIFITLHDRTKKNEFGYAFANSSSLGSKIWPLANDWKALLIHDPDNRNAKQVLNAMILWHKTQNKKMMRHLNKQYFCVSSMNVGRKSKKWKNAILMERVL